MPAKALKDVKMTLDYISQAPTNVRNNNLLMKSWLYENWEACRLKRTQRMEDMKNEVFL